MREIERKSWDFSWDPSGFLEPLIELKEGEEEIIITADLPSVEKEDIEVHATENSLMLQAKMKKAYCFERWGAIQKGITFKYFRKVIGLPSPVDIERVESRFHKGMLEIKLPKKTNKRRINVI